VHASCWPAGPDLAQFSLRLILFFFFFLFQI
jgi:hypothetical protein